MKRSEMELRFRIEQSREAGERLDRIDYVKRNWLALYAADNDIIGDALEAALDSKGEPMSRGRTVSW